MTMTSFSQSKISLFGGLNYTPPTSDFFEELYGEASFGLHFGIAYDLPLLARLSFRPKLIYSQQGDRKSTNDEGNYTISRTDTFLDFINVPLNIKFGKKTYILFGPQVGFLINSKANGNYFSEIKSIVDYGVNLGFGKRIIKRMFIELNFYKGFATFLEFKESWNETQNIQNFYAQLSVGFTIN